MSRLILASGSPRRQTLLTLAGFNIDAVIPPMIPEVREPNELPLDYVRRLASEKAAAVDSDKSWVLAADTIVHRGASIFEKPVDDQGAAHILSQLAGDWHKVTTAWCLRWSGATPSPTRRRLIRGHSTSRVRFRPLSSVEIDRYIATGEGRDKAGGYAVQGDGAALIERVVGSTTNVVGLPLDTVIKALHAAGIARATA
jgi:septum formation protein